MILGLDDDFVVKFGLPFYFISYNVGSILQDWKLQFWVAMISIPSAGRYITVPLDSLRLIMVRCIMISFALVLHRIFAIVSHILKSHSLSVVLMC